MRLSTRLFLLIAACLLPIVGMQLYAQYSLRQQHRQELAELALHQAELANGDLASIAGGLQQLAAAVAQIPSVQIGGPDCASQLAAVQRHTPSVLFLAVFARSGRELCASRPLSGSADRAPAWVTDLLTPPARDIGRYAVLPGGQGFVPLAVPMDHAGRPSAIMVAALDLRWLSHHLIAIRLGPKESAAHDTLYIADRDGIIIGRVPDAAGWIGRILPAALRQAITPHQPGITPIAGSDSHEHLVASVPADVPPTGLIAVESLSVAAMIPGVIHAAWHDTLPMLAAAVLALVLAWLTGRYFIARPTGYLLSAAQRWRDGDLSARAKRTRSSSEFATLAESFNAMASSLQARELERRLHAELLEVQVAERTRALSESNNRLQVEIAEREKTEVALHQAQKLQAVGQLAGGIAHDFNNMLATVLGSLELMERRVAQSAKQWTEADAERLAKLIDRATGAVLRGSQLTSRLLAFSRRQRLAARPTDLNRLVTDLATLAAPTLGRRVQVTTTLAETLWPALVDPSQVEAAILNCCLNARDAMPEGGRLTLATSNHAVRPGESAGDPAPGDYVRVTITDTGSGMALEVLQRAFDPFFTTKGPGGSGLGLSQVYGMVRQCGGTVRIASTPGEGTAVTLLLPRAEQDADDAPAPMPGAARPELPATLVLVVDDDVAVRQVTVEMLKALGCDVMQAACGADALALLEATGRVPEMALLDYAMPGLNGVELARALRARSLSAPIALVTGYAELSDRESDGSPFDALLRKPFTIRELESLLARLRRLAHDGLQPAWGVARQV